MLVDGLRYDGWVYRPPTMATKGMVASGHQLASLAGLRMLERGGNAVDAGVTAGLCLAVVHSDFVNLAGVAPIIIYMADRREVVTLAGIGPWPRKASIEFFQRQAGGDIPAGVLRSVVPGAPDAWITALERFGTLSFAEVAAPAIELAESGFPMHRFMAGTIAEHANDYGRYPSSASIYLPNGRPPSPGERFVQTDLARTLHTMVHAERRAAPRGRSPGLRAARDAFYTGEIAHTIVEFYAKEGGLLAYEDLAAYQVQMAPPVMTDYRGYEVYACGPWCQGPLLPQVLNLLEPHDLRSMAPADPEYVHLLVEAMKLAFADRHAYYGDPNFVQVPLETLLSKTYASARSQLIDPDRAMLEMPMPGDVQTSHVQSRPPVPGGHRQAPDGGLLIHPDTSYVCAVDRDGNGFSATPSDTSFDVPVVSGTGLAVSSRGVQGWLDAGHPNAVAPGKRPRLTPSPALVLRDGRLAMVFGTPGSDVQCQAMLQVFLNIVEFGMNPQAAIEAPRVATYSFPATHHPHPYQPQKLYAESRMDSATLRGLARKGHALVDWGAWNWLAGAVCAIVVDGNARILIGGADPRRESIAIGW